MPRLSTQTESDRPDAAADDFEARPARRPYLRLLALAAFLIGVSITLMHRPWSQPEGGDEAIWDYVAQCIVRGQTPYRDVVEIKSPLSAYLSAAAMLIGRSAGLSEIIAVRLLNVLMAGSLAAITFLVAVAYLRGRLLACLAFLIPFAPTHFADWMAAGTEPKLPMIVFGLLSLWLIAKGKPFWAGLFSMLSCLCWQPGLIFTGVALLMFSRYLTNWRDTAAMKTLAGAALPLGAALLYFYSIGALADFWTWTVVYNLRVYAPETARGVGQTVALLWKVAVRVFRFDLAFVAFSAAGMAVFAIERVRAKIKDRKLFESPCSFRDAIVIAPVIYMAFCLINFQSGPDLIPLFPFIGMFGGWFIVKLGGVRFARGLVPAAALAVVLAMIAFRSLTYAAGTEFTLQDQQKAFGGLPNVLAPDDRIYVHGTVELLVLLNRANLNPYIFLDRGKDDWVARRMPGGFRELIDEMEASSPKIVAISRLGKVAHRAELSQWVEDRYDRMEVPGYEGIYLRRQR